MKQEPPFISIVIPTYNRPQQLSVCLRACIASTIAMITLKSLWWTTAESRP